MKTRHGLIATGLLSLTAAIGAGIASLPAAPQDPAPEVQPEQPMFPEPTEHHKWLDQLVGTWSFESEMGGEGMPAVKATGTDTVRSIGGRWVIGELHSEIPGMGKMHAVLTLGYNTETGKYQGTWVDSMTDVLWVYEGTLDPTQKILTLEAEGPNMVDPAAGKTRFRDAIEFKSDDLRTLTSSALVDGQWVQFGTSTYHRTK